MSGNKPALSGKKPTYRGLDPIPPAFASDTPPIASVVEELCIACDRCPPLCFFDALVMEARPGHPYGRTAVVHPRNCTGCGLCFEACPADAIIWIPDATQASVKARVVGSSRGRKEHESY